MPDAPELRPSVGRHGDPRLAAAGAVYRRVATLAALATLAVGLIGVSAALVPRRAAPLTAVAPPVVTLPPPLVITIDRTVTVTAPPSTGAAPEAKLGCPVLTSADTAIGTPVELSRDAPAQPSGASEATVVAASHAPQLAVLRDHHVWASDDDGATFQRAFADRQVDHVAIDRDGTVYAQAGATLGIRAPGGRTRWRDVAHARCEDRCRDQLGVVGDRLVWIHDREVATSLDRGASWHAAPAPAFSWNDLDSPPFAWAGALYQVAHYVDQCGVDDYSVFRLDARGRIEHDVFHAYFVPSEPVLRPSSDVDTTWTWRERCWTDEDNVLGRCDRRDAKRSALLAASTVLPREGGRTLAVYDHSLIELCQGGARQIYRAFPLDHLDAVDAGGRPLVVHGDALLRWSPAHGWRRLLALPAPAPDSP